MGQHDNSKLNMKTLLAISLLSLSISANAGTTNITTKITVENSITGTNSVSYSLNQGAGSPKDDLTIESLVWYYANSKSSGIYTNVFEQWLKDTTKTALQSHNAEKSANDLGAAAAKVAAAASTDISLLTNTQKAQIIAIAATLP